MRYLNMLDCDIADGEGIRVALFVSGCSHKCPGCHNPESWDCNNGKEFDEQAKERLFKLLDRPYINGLTLTGGDPLFEKNIDEITKLVYEVRQKFPEKTIWLYTGYNFEDVKRLKIFRCIDVVVDGPFVQHLRDITLPFRGSSNQKIIRLRDI